MTWKETEKEVEESTECEDIVVVEDIEKSTECEDIVVVEDIEENINDEEDEAISEDEFFDTTDILDENIGVVGVSDEVESSVENEIEEGDETIPYDASDESDDVTFVPRRSKRIVKPKETFTYDKIGGDPKFTS